MRKNNQHITVENLFALCRGELDLEQINRYMSHIDECDECSNAFEAMKAFEDAELRQPSVEYTEKQLDEKLLHITKQHIEASQKNNYVKMFKGHFYENGSSYLAAVAASLLLIAFVEFILPPKLNPMASLRITTTKIEGTYTELRKEDSLALIALYDATSGASWTNVWDLSLPMDTWYGIRLNEYRCVESLHLAHNNLKGTIPKEIGNLNGLKFLVLNDNQLTGPIPHSILDLKLTHLYLMNNPLTSNALDLKKTCNISSSDIEISTKTNLETWGEFHNDTIGLCDYDIYVFPGDCSGDGITHATDFTALGLLGGNTNYTRPDATTEWISEQSCEWTDFFNVINSAHADSGGNGIASLQPDRIAIEQNYGLTTDNLYVYSCYGSKSLRFELVPNTLETDIDSSKYAYDLLVESKSGGKVYAHGIGGIIVFDDLPIEDTTLDLCLPVEYFSKLISDTLYFALTRTDGVNQLIDSDEPIAIIVVNDLQEEAELENEPIADDILCIGDFITARKSDSNIFGHASLVGKLQYDINGADKVPWTANNGNFNTYLSGDLNLDGDVNGQDKALWSCHNGVVGDHYFPLYHASDNDFIGDSLALVALYNSTNGENWIDKWDLTQPMDEWEGVTVDSDGRVSVLSLSNNNLTGTIPVELGNLDKLFIIAASGNSITGIDDIPQYPAYYSKEGPDDSIDFAYFPNLEKLDLSYNQLSGTIPEILSMIPKLTYLDVSYNQLSLDIPKRMYEMRLLYFNYIGNRPKPFGKD